MMRLLGLTEQDEVVVEVTVGQRAELATFIERSLQTKQVDFDAHSPVDRTQLEQIRASIAGTLADPGRWLVLPRVDWHQLVKLASGWRWHGYEGHDRGFELDVPRARVDAILQLAEEIYAAMDDRGE